MTKTKIYAEFSQILGSILLLQLTGLGIFALLCPEQLSPSAALILITAALLGAFGSFLAKRWRRSESPDSFMDRAPPASPDQERLLHIGRMASLGRMKLSVLHDMKNQIAVSIGYLEQQ